MTYGYETEPLADTASKLGVTVPRPLLDVVHEYADGLPITAAHVVQTGTRTFRFYWVSGLSLVVLESQEVEKEDAGFVIRAAGQVRPIKSARLDLEVTALQAPAPVQDWTLIRTLRLTFDGEAEPMTLPDPLSLPLDSEPKRDQVNSLLDAVLQAYTTN
ncbi:hypothetical protein [Mycobacterium sp. IS-1264]|uniref:hypothetical protein n=1 Tax=Mycobacterium sp. IS-1264 TaxID=1834158 RepID=UPI001115A124|nr:hypothetical protein [Mycobacterium sp. IS-1264]